MGGNMTLTKTAIGHKGFTLIELLASLVLLGIVVAVFGMGLVGALDNFNFNRANVRIAQETHVAMARMSRELQELLPLYDAANNINGIVGGANFIIYERAADAPRSGQSPTVRYALVHPAGTSRILLYTGLGSNVHRISDLPDGGGDILIDNVSAFTLSYFNGSDSWTQTDSIRQLSAIRISLTIARDDDPAHSEDFTTLVFPRNIGSKGGAAL